MKRKRIIISYSDVITNSSTQVFFLDIEEKLIKFLNDNNITKDVVIIRDKEDVIRAIEIYQKEEDEHGYGGDSTIFEMMSHVNEWYDMYTEYGKGDQWKRLNEAGRTDREIVEFIWPLIKDITGKVFYSFADDCGTLSTAEILWEGGYYSYRE